MTGRVQAATSTEDTVEWLRQRALVGDVLTAFAYHLDRREWRQWIDLFADDGVLELPIGTKDKATLERDGGPKGLLAMHATHHISSNHRIEVEGDTARANSYVQATHVVDADDRDSQWVLAGWYDTTLRRTPQGWRIVRQTLTKVWS